MSSEHQALVFNAAGLSGPEKLLLLAVCDITDAHGTCTSGVKRLAHMTGTSESTVKNQRRRLVERNLLISLARSDSRGVAQHNVYRVNLELLRAMHDPYLDESDNLLDQLQFKPMSSENKLSTGGSDLDPPLAEKLSTGGSDLDPPRSGSAGGGSDLDPPYGVDLDPRQISTHPHPDTERSKRNPETSSGNGAKPEKPVVTDKHKRAAQALLDKHDLSPVNPVGKQPTQIRNAVAGAFATGCRAADVNAYLQDKLNEGETVKWLLGAFAPFRLHEIKGYASPGSTGHVPPPCGECDARPHDPVTARIEWLDAERVRSRRCTRCHPDAIAEAVRTLQDA